MTCTLRELIDALPSPHLLAPAAESDREHLLDAPIRSVCCDSRDAGADSLFFCLRGMRIDGHDFASAAEAHFALEKIYTAAMDFRAVTTFTDTVCARVLGKR